MSTRQSPKLGSKLDLTQGSPSRSRCGSRLALFHDAHGDLYASPSRRSWGAPAVLGGVSISCCLSFRFGCRRARQPGPERSTLEVKRLSGAKSFRTYRSCLVSLINQGTTRSPCQGLHVAPQTGPRLPSRSHDHMRPPCQAYCDWRATLNGRRATCRLAIFC